MSYVKKTVLPGENILYSTRPHYAVFSQLLLWPTLLTFMYKFNCYNELIGGVLFLMAIFSFFTVLISYYYSEYAVTNKRVIMKIGFIRRKSLEIFLDRIEGIYVDQSILGRILNFGTVVIIGVGSTKNPFFYIPSPTEFHKKIQAAMQQGPGNICSA